ncbi:TetR/AcrR family transcriptional regulator [Propionibacteriaceae bacterium Y1923]
MARPKLHDENLRQRLLEAATDLVAEKGDTFALRPLAESLDTSTTAIYSLFGSRDALLEAVAEQAAKSFADALEAVRHDDSLTWILSLGVGYRRWALESPSRFHIVSTAQVDSEDLRSVRAMSLRPLGEAVQQAMDEGYVQGNVEDICTTWYAGVHGFILLEISGILTGGDEQFLRLADSLFLAHATPKGVERLREQSFIDLHLKVVAVELV